MNHDVFIGAVVKLVHLAVHIVDLLVKQSRNLLVIYRLFLGNVGRRELVVTAVHANEFSYFINREVVRSDVRWSVNNWFRNSPKRREFVVFIPHVVRFEEIFETCFNV